MSTLASGDHVDRYIVEGKLGEGPASVVYRVRHDTMATAHALKVLWGLPSGTHERLVREVRAQALLQHENVVRVLDILSVDGHPALLMELAEGPALGVWLSRYRPTLEESLALFRGICAGVGHAHARDILHRDLQPSNILLALTDDRLIPKVTDFGLAKDLAKLRVGNTRIGSTMGILGFMAPEQITSPNAVDRRADLWSLGCLLYALTTGVVPFDGDDLAELFKVVKAGDYVPTRRLAPHLPDRVHVLVEGLLEVPVERRIADCATVLAYLDGEIDQLPPLKGLARARVPATAQPRWLDIEGEAADVARSITRRTLGDLPKLERGAVKLDELELEPGGPPDPSGRSDRRSKRKRSSREAPSPESTLPTLPPRPSPLAAPAPRRLGRNFGEDEPIASAVPDGPPPARASRILLGLSLLGALGMAALFVVVGAVGMVLIVRSPPMVGKEETVPPLVALPTPPPERPEPETHEAQPDEPPSAPVPKIRPGGGGRTPPEPARPAAPSNAPGRVTFSGVERLWLRSTGESPADLHELGSVPPGRYLVFAVFPDATDPSGAGEVVVRAGQTSRLVCIADFARCKQQ